MIRTVSQIWHARQRIIVQRGRCFIHVYYATSSIPVPDNSVSPVSTATSNVCRELLCRLFAVSPLVPLKVLNKQPARVVVFFCRSVRSNNLVRALRALPRVVFTQKSTRADAEAERGISSGRRGCLGAAASTHSAPAAAAAAGSSRSLRVWLLVTQAPTSIIVSAITPECGVPVADTFRSAATTPPPLLGIFVDPHNPSRDVGETYDGNNAI